MIIDRDPGTKQKGVWFPMMKDKNRLVNMRRNDGEIFQSP
jgi:hypothetical protein